ncbi:MAG: alpha/beta fold hydrolase [Bradyrhizobium sp.]
MLNYRRFGNGPTLVMQHGFMGGCGYWLPQLGNLGASFDVITPDLAGFAGSRDETVQESIEGHAAAVCELLDWLKVQRYHLLGHSMGGMIALQIALDYPQRVGKLVLYGTSSSGNLPSRFEPLEASIRRIEQEGLDACAQRIVRTWFIDGDAAPYYSLSLDAGRGTRADAAIAALACIARWDVTRRLAEIDAPSLVLCGDRDRSVDPQQAYALWRGIDRSELCIAPGCAHNVHLDAPDFFNHVVRHFLLKTA